MLDTSLEMLNMLRPTGRVSIRTRFVGASQISDAADLITSERKIQTKVLAQDQRIVVLGGLLQPTLAQDSLERAGYFEVRSASTRQVAGVHTLDARLQLVLSSEALDALSSGVPLVIELQLHPHGRGR